jgi:hypothetical protein
MPGRTLLKRVRAMGHAIWLPKPPPRSCNVQAHNPGGSKPDTRAHEGRRPSSNVDARDHLIAEQGVQVASAALLEGEEMRKLAKSSKQTAAPGTPSTFNTPSTPPTITPANSEATAQPRRRTRARTPKPSCTVHNFQSGRMVHPGTSPPCLAPSLRASGVFAEDPDEAGGVTTEKRSAQAQTRDPNGAESTPVAKTAGASTRAPHTPVEAKRSPDRPPRKNPPEGMSPTCAARPDAQPNGQRRRPHGGGPCHSQQHGQGSARHARARVPHRRWPQPSLSPQSKYPMQRGTLSHTARPDSQGARRAASTTSTPTRWPVSQQNPGLAHSEAALPPSPLARTTCVSCAPRRAAHWRAIQLWPSSMARNRRTILGGRPPFGAATSQPAPGTPIGRQSSGSTATPPAHPTRILHTQRSAAHRGPFKRDGSMAVDRRATSGAHPPSSRVGTSQQRTVARRHHGLAAPRLTHRSGHRNHA